MNKVLIIIKKIINYVEINHDRIGYNNCINILFNIIYSYMIDFYISNYTVNISISDINKLRTERYRKFKLVMRKYEKRILEKNLNNIKFKGLHIFIRLIVNDFSSIFKISNEITYKLMIKEIDMVTINTKNINNKNGGSVLPNPSYLSGTGTGRSFSTLVKDMDCTVKAFAATLISGTKVVKDLIELPMDMGTAFEAKGAPKPSDIHIGDGI